MAEEQLVSEVESKLRASVAEGIRRELVCCDAYDRGVLPSVGHAICYWGEAAARIAEGAPTPE
jgi:hypothetical protein